MALKAESEEDTAVCVVLYNSTYSPFSNEHLTCFHTLECPFQGNGILHKAIAKLKAWNRSEFSPVL